MALAMFAVCERVRLVASAVSIVLCTLGGAQSMEGNRYRVLRAIGSSGLVVGICVIGTSGGFGMTMSSVLWDICELDDSEGVCAFQEFLPWAF